MPSHRRPDRHLRRVAHLARARWSHVREIQRNRPRPSVQGIVGQAAQLAALAERRVEGIREVITVLNELLHLNLTVFTRHVSVDTRERSVSPTGGTDRDNVPNVPAAEHVRVTISNNDDENVSVTPVVDIMLDVTNISANTHNVNQDAQYNSESPGMNDDPQELEDDASEQNDNVCFICLTRPNQVQLPCSHRLCGHCPARIHSQDPRCPYCRSPFNSFTILLGVDENEVVPLEDTASYDVQTRSFPFPDPSDLDDWEAPVSTPVITYTSVNGVTSSLREWGAPDWEGFVTCPYCQARIRNAPSRLVRHAHRCLHARPDLHPNNLQ